jgi:hypothetical protein
MKIIVLNAPLLSMVIVFPAITSAFGQHHLIPDGQIPWGIEGTIGRNYEPEDTAVSSRTSAGALGNFSGTRGYFVAPRSFSIWTGLRPYRTNMYYAPGDGYRYPLYYNPATGAYFYYPVRR